MLILIFLFGLIVGSFLNALIHRLHSGQKIVNDRSRCVSCGHELRVLDLIPLVSFVFLRGRCRYCAKKISWQYPIVELATALSFLLLFVNHESIGDHGLWAKLVFASTFIVIAVYDFKHYLILDKVVFPILIVSLVLNVYFGTWLEGILGALALSGFFLLQYAISKGRWIGFGDVKLGLLLGLVLGLKLGALSLMLAYFLGAIVGIGLMLSGRKSLSSRLPFGTFLGISAIIVLIYGQEILNWYLNILGF
jgi:leader peptidase (prepilin peptidase)/N-methyltransferase